MIPDTRAIFDKHTSNDHKLCYAASLGPITAFHSNGAAPTTFTLRCTLPLGHSGAHRDSACCYSPHEFSANLATPPNPDWRKLERCVECGQKWPCDVEQLRLQVGVA